MLDFEQGGIEVELSRWYRNHLWFMWEKNHNFKGETTESFLKTFFPFWLLLQKTGGATRILWIIES